LYRKRDVRHAIKDRQWLQQLMAASTLHTHVLLPIKTVCNMTNISTLPYLLSRIIIASLFTDKTGKL